MRNIVSIIKNAYVSRILKDANDFQTIAVHFSRLISTPVTDEDEN